MPALRDTIADLFTQAATRTKAEGTVTRGLQLTARIVDGRRQLLLSRPDEKPSDVEVSTCAKHGDFTSYEVTGGPRWQLISELGGRATTTLPAQVCGTCVNGTPGEYPDTVECLLGWERQDGVLRPVLGGKFEWIPVPQGHGGLPAPIMHPEHSCIAVIGNGHPGWAAK